MASLFRLEYIYDLRCTFYFSFTREITRRGRPRRVVNSRFDYLCYHGNNLVGSSKMIKSKLLEKLKSFDDFDVVFESSDLSRYSIDDVICHTEKSEIVLKENVYQIDLPKISRIFLKLTRMYQEGTIKDVFEDLKTHLKEEKNILNSFEPVYDGNLLITCFNSLTFYKEALDFLKQFLKISKLQEFDNIQDLFYFVKSTILVDINLRKF